MREGWSRLAVLSLLLAAACSQDGNTDAPDPMASCPVLSAPLWAEDLRQLGRRAWPGGSGYATYLERGVALFRQERFSGAASNFDTAAGLAPRCPEPLVLSGRAQVAAVRSGEVGRDQDDPQAAEKAAEKALEAAVATLDQAIQRDPTLADAYRYKAQALFAASTANPTRLPFGSAIPIFRTLEQALALAPDHAPTERFFIEVAAAYANTMLTSIRIGRDRKGDDPALSLSVLQARLRITDYYLKTFVADAAERNQAYLSRSDPRSVTAQLRMLSYLGEFEAAQSVFDTYAEPDAENPIPDWRELMTTARRPIEPEPR